MSTMQLDLETTMMCRFERGSAPAHGGSFVFPEICLSHSETLSAVLVGEFVLSINACFKDVWFVCLKVHHFDT